MSEEKSIEKVYVVFCEDLDDNVSESLSCVCETEVEAQNAVKYLEYTTHDTYDYKEVLFQVYDLSSLNIVYNNSFHCELRPTEDKDTFVMGCYHIYTTEKINIPLETRFSIFKTIFSPTAKEETKEEIKVHGEIVSKEDISKMPILEQRKYIMDEINSKGIIKVTMPHPLDFDAMV